MKWHFNKDARGFEPMIFEFRQDVSILLLECGYYRIYWTCSKKQLNDAVVSWPQKIIKIAGGDNFWLLTIIMPAPLPHKPFVLNSLWLCQFRGYLNLKTNELKMRSVEEECFKLKRPLWWCLLIPDGTSADILVSRMNWHRLLSLNLLCTNHALCYLTENKKKEKEQEQQEERMKWVYR